MVPIASGILRMCFGKKSSTQGFIALFDENSILYFARRRL
jgi:hypothetical protein